MRPTAILGRGCWGQIRNALRNTGHYFGPLRRFARQLEGRCPRAVIYVPVSLVPCWEILPMPGVSVGKSSQGQIGRSEVYTLTPPQIARRWGTKSITVRRLLKTGQLMGFSVSAAGSSKPRWRVTLDNLLAYERGESGLASKAKEKSRRRTVRTLAPSGPF